MRRPEIIVRLLLVGASLGAAAEPANAQSFFQKLFGFGTPAATSQKARPPVPSLRSFQRFSPYGMSSSRSPYDPYQQYRSQSPAAYRTLCVRTCDGYYWPMSSGTTRSRFHQDAEACEASCNGEAKLFYLPRGSDDIENMTDLTGRTYGRLPAAFAYRKSLIAGCSCRPMPWSPVEAARHRNYALVDKLEQERAALEAPATAAVPVAIETGETWSLPADKRLEDGPRPESVMPGELSSDMRTPAIAKPTLASMAVPGREPTHLELLETEGTAEDATGGFTEQPAPSNRTRQRGAQKRAAQSPASFAGWFSAGGGAYVWPGDRPRRTR